jgi:hypothetical protein
MQRLKIIFFNILKKLMERKGWVLVKNTPVAALQPVLGQLHLSGRDREYLQIDNPRLQELNQMYRTLDSELTQSEIWNPDRVNNMDLLANFRGDRGYVWQLRGGGMFEPKYLLTTYYLLLNDSAALLSKVFDDGVFGSHVFRVADRLVSREILDSVNEINFLEKHLKLSMISDLKLLDIGAGYGRLAHRLCEVVPQLKAYYCTDAIPLSVFICEFYIRYRNVTQARVVEMPSLVEKLKGEKIQVAINIHSFSECTLQAIDWWIKMVSILDIQYLFIVPNAFEDEGKTLLTNKREDFLHILTKYNYELKVKSPKYNDPAVQKYGLYPTYYYLFEKIS